MDCAHTSDWWLLSVSLNCAVLPDFSKAMSRNSVRLAFGSSWLHLSTAAVCPRFASADPSNDCPGWVAVAPEFPNVFASNLNIKTWISHETNSFVKKWRLHYRLISEDPFFCALNILTRHSIMSSYVPSGVVPFDSLLVAPLPSSQRPADCSSAEHAKPHQPCVSCGGSDCFNQNPGWLSLKRTIHPVCQRLLKESCSNC